MAGFPLLIAQASKFIDITNEHKSSQAQTLNSPITHDAVSESCGIGWPVLRLRIDRPAKSSRSCSRMTTETRLISKGCVACTACAARLLDGRAARRAGPAVGQPLLLSRSLSLHNPDVAKTDRVAVTLQIDGTALAVFALRFITAGWNRRQHIPVVDQYTVVSHRDHRR